jgi:hypothetical protein
MSLFHEFCGGFITCCCVGIFIWAICLLLRFLINDIKNPEVRVIVWFIRHLFFIMWLLLCVSIIGDFWLKVVQPENVPNWVIMLFKTH